MFDYFDFPRNNDSSTQKIRDYSHWYTLYVQTEVYEAMTCVVAECAQAASMCLFASHYGKEMKLYDFEDLQTQATVAVIKYLKEPWLIKITQSVRMCLRDLGKGWFNLKQDNHRIYDVMKLNRFMNLTTLRMQVSRSIPKHHLFVKLKNDLTCRLRCQ